MIVIVDSGGSYEDRALYFIKAALLSDVMAVVRKHNKVHEHQAEIMGTCERVKWLKRPATAITLSLFRTRAEGPLGL